MAIGQDFRNRSAVYLALLAGAVLVVLGAIVATSQPVQGLLLSLLAAYRRAPVAEDWPRNLRASGIESLVLGLVLIAGATFVAVRRSLLRALVSDTRAVVLASAGLLALLWLPVILVGRSAVIGGVRYWWLTDDAMISMRYARNLVSGFGLVWNVGERVEGYTNFLWTLFMALVHLLPLPPGKLSLVVMLANLLLGMATIPILVPLVRLLGGGTAAVLATSAAYVLSRSVMYHATYGLETMLLTFLVTWAAYRVLHEAQTGEPRPLTYLLIAAIALVRADALVLSALLYALAFLLERAHRRQVVLYAAVSLLLPAAHLAFRVTYYGELLPNTAYLKTTGWDGRVIAGIGYVARFSLRFLLLLLVSLAAVLSTAQPGRRLLLAAIGVYMAYVAYVGGDFFPEYRYFVPVLPLLLAVTFAGLECLPLGPGAVRVRTVLGVLCVVSIPLVTPGYAVALFPWQGDVGNVEIGLLLRQDSLPDSRVADFSAGTVPYFSERYAVDLLGKSDRHIAHLLVVSDGMLPGHNKFDFDYSLGLVKPDFVVANFKLPVDEASMLQVTRGDRAFTGQLYFHPLFRAHCLPNPLPQETWRTVFVCDWSPELERVGSWRGLGAKERAGPR